MKSIFVFIISEDPPQIQMGCRWQADQYLFIYADNDDQVIAFVKNDHLWKWTLNKIYYKYCLI